MSPMNPRLLRPLARRQAPAPAAPMATMVSTKSGGDVVLYAASSSGYYKVEWWDNTSSVETNDSVPYKGTGDAGAKTIRVYACDENGNPSGDLIGLNIPFNALTSLDVSGLTALTSLDCYANALTSLDVSGLTALTSLNCGNNALTSLRAVGVALGGGVATYPSLYYIWGGNVEGNSLSAAALNQFYADLAPSAGYIIVNGNPGSVADDPTIATAKGYAIYGS